VTVHADVFPLPDNAYWDRMRAGHLIRTGHELNARLLADDTGICQLVRLCCDE
jgi:hypothetical protein